MVLLHSPTVLNRDPRSSFLLRELRPKPRQVSSTSELGPAPRKFLKATLDARSCCPCLPQSGIESAKPFSQFRVTVPSRGASREAITITTSNNTDALQSNTDRLARSHAKQAKRTDAKLPHNKTERTEASNNLKSANLRRKALPPPCCLYLKGA